MPHKDPEERKKYHKEYMRRRYREDPEHRARHRARTDKNDARYIERNKALVVEFRKQGCLLCPEKEACCLSAHHKDPTLKEFSIASAVYMGLSEKRMIEELAKCICLCENCHRKVHAGVLQLP